jgi:Rieske 2Fe-2S family protein
MPPSFDPAGFDLKPLPAVVIAGLVLISFDDAPPALDAVGVALGALDARYSWREAKVAARRTYAVAANWKLAMENYHECYHCAVAHPEFSVHHMLARPKNRDARSGEDLEVWGSAPDGLEVARLIYSPLAEESLTGSRDGQLVAPVMDARGPEAGDCVFAEAGFLSAFLAYADHGVIYRFIPRATLHTEMEVIWLVRGDAQEGRDYDVEALTWLWDVTSVADKRIIEMNQAGVRSRAYRPGPYSLMEPGTRAYTDRYLSELARHDL